MIMIKINNDDLRYFDSFVTQYPNKTEIVDIMGFDGNTVVQLLVELSKDVLPTFIEILSIFLAYKATKKQEALQEKEIELHEKEIRLQENETDNKKFEIKVLSDSCNITFSGDDLNNSNYKELLENIVSTLKSSVNE